MEAAEKIPKKLYVYLDTTRGSGGGHGGQAVHRSRPSAGLRHQRQRGIWAGILFFIIMEMRKSASLRSRQQSLLFQEEQHQAQGQQVGAAAGAEIFPDVLPVQVV